MGGGWGQGWVGLCEHGGEGRVRFPEKVMSHYELYKLLPCIEKLTVYRQNYRQADRQTESIVGELSS